MLIGNKLEMTRVKREEVSCKKSNTKKRPFDIAPWSPFHDEHLQLFLALGCLRLLFPCFFVAAFTQLMLDKQIALDLS